MALNKRILRMLSEHKAKYIGVLVLILLGSFVMVLMTGIGQNMDGLITSFIEQNRQEDACFALDAPISNIAKLEDTTGSIIEAQHSSDISLSDTLTLRLLSETKKVNIPAITEGRGINQNGEILLMSAFATANGYEIGESIEAGGKAFTVVGFMALPHYIYPTQYVNELTVSYDNFGVAIISPADFEGLRNSDTSYSVRFLEREESMGAQAARLRGELSTRGNRIKEWVDVENNKRASMAATSMSSAKVMSVPIPMAMFLMCCLITSIMIWRMVRADSIIIGTLYAQGYRRRELLRHYLALPILIAIAGSVAGSLLALPCIGPAVRVFAYFFIIPITDIGVNAIYAIGGVLLPLLLMGLSSFFVINSALKHSPAELMKGGAASPKVNPLERSLNLEKLKFGTKFKLREQLRSISRLLFLLLGVTGASTLMLWGFTMISSVNAVFNNDTVNYNFEYEYTFRETQFGEAPDGAGVFTNARFYSQEDTNIEFTTCGIEPEADMMTLLDASGTPLANNQINITSALAQRLGVSPGDEVTVINKQDGMQHTFHIDAIADAYTIQMIYIPISQLNELLDIPGNAYTGIWSSSKLDIPEEELLGFVKMSEIGNAAKDFMGPVYMEAGAISFMACIIGIIIIYLVTTLIIEESRSTVSMFKIFGYKRHEIRKLL